ncbi:hypothetical protein HHL11_20325 [Ramlibacter sp. G-1-2-2]|uniref:C2H2-type domain-containing protein n=1 Tax=Ramlibacter agri TaxID=2728837 RepID=A0A848H5N4_9BURK|nr:hypothetical protein [Ramlibacter agri]NML46105.1 hypothetical protein [Ramlibacter agri]
MEPGDDEAGLAVSIFEKSCLYCGARFRVLAPHGQQGDHREEYACPECGKEYQVDASVEPEVQLLQPRRDGKNDRYQETMF